MRRSFDSPSLSATTTSDAMLLAPTLSPPPSAPPSIIAAPFVDLCHDFDSDSDYDELSDRDELEEGYLLHRREPLAVHRRAMATDFSEGRLETFVGNPQKELSGTQNQYVSYLVTTKVGT